MSRFGGFGGGGYGGPGGYGGTGGTGGYGNWGSGSGVTNPSTTGAGRGWTYGNWGGPGGTGSTGGATANPPVVQRPTTSGVPRPNPPPATIRVTQTFIAGGPSQGAPVSGPTAGAPPNPVQSASGAEPIPSALQALNPGKDGLQSDDPSRTSIASSTDTLGSGAGFVNPTNTSSNDSVSRPGPGGGGGGGPSLAGILVGVFGGLLLACAIAAGVVVMRRRRRARRNGAQLDPREEDGDPRPFTLPPPSPRTPYERSLRGHGLAIQVDVSQDRDVERSPMQEAHIYSPIFSPAVTFTRDTKGRQSHWQGDRIVDYNPASANTLAWASSPFDTDRSSTVASSEPGVDLEHPSSEALVYADPPPAYQTGSMTAAPLGDSKSALGRSF